jgi:GTPase SAR1 family protein
MRLPGSNIDVTFENEIVIVRDENTSKFIDIGGMTFEDILTEVQSFAYIRSCRPARRLLKFILLRTGLPDQEEFPRHDILNEEDLDVLENALDSVGDLTDVVRSAQRHNTIAPEIETQASSTMSAAEDDTDTPAASSSPAAEEETEIPVAPEQEIPESERSTIWTSDDEVEMVYRFSPDNVPKRTAEESVEESGVMQSHDSVSAEFDVFDESSSVGLTRLKVLLLGEKGVGKRSILQRAGFSIYESAVFGSLQTDSPLAYSKIVGYHNERIRIDAWLPEGAVEARLPHEEFYAETGAIVLVYSVSDRASFDKMEFWIEEASSMFLTPAPVLIVANKRDLQDAEVPPEPDDNFVSTEEGKNLRDRIAEKLGPSYANVPIEFTESYRAIDENIGRIVESILDLWERNNRLTVPIVESLA